MFFFKNERFSKKSGSFGTQLHVYWQKADTTRVEGVENVMAKSLFFRTKCGFAHRCRRVRDDRRLQHHLNIRFLSVFISCLFSALSGGFLISCSESMTISRNLAVSSSSEISWNGPNLADFGAFSTAASSSNCKFPATGTDYASFASYRLKSSSTQGAFAGVLCQVNKFRSVGRVYLPRSAGGSGWSSALGASGVLDSVNTLSLTNGMTDTAVGIDVNGNLFATFWGASWNSTTGTGVVSAGLLSGGGWDYFTSTNLSAVATPVSSSIYVEGGLTPVYAGNSELNDLSWDRNGVAYFGSFATLPTTEKGVVVEPYIAYSGWDTGGTKGLTTKSKQATTCTSYDDSTCDYDGLATGTQFKLLDDGFGITALWNFQASDYSNRLGVAWSLSASGSAGFGLDWFYPRTQEMSDELQPFIDAAGISGSVFDAASDGNGNLLLVYTAANENSVTCATSAENCNTRLYAYYRSSSGVWSGPSRVDENLATVSDEKTSFWQTYEYTSGADKYSYAKPFSKPVVAYVGNDRFIAVYTVNDVSTASKPVTTTYYRGYTINKGWDEVSATQTLRTDSLAPTTAGGSTFEQYRRINDMKFVGTPGYGLLLLQHAIDADGVGVKHGSKWTRGYSYTVHALSGETFGSGVTFNATNPKTEVNSAETSRIPSCKAFTPSPTYAVTACGTKFMADAMVFKDGEAVVIFPAPKTADSDAPQYRLYSMEYYRH